MILNTYEEFTMLNNDIITYINELVKNNFSAYDENEVINYMSGKLSSMENLKFKSDEIITDISENDKINELRYLIMNSLFLLSDLIHFYKLGEFDRFKMRALNYISQNSKEVYYN